MEQDFLCAALKGRIRYFTTRYRKAHDGYGRVAILVDGKEVVNMPFTVEDKGYAEVYSHKPSETGKSYAELHQEVKIKYNEAGLFYPGDFGTALDSYLSNPISDSLKSDDWLVRLLAILDRRVGKRTLLKLKSDITQLPPWLQEFYHLRFESESLL